MNRFRTRKKAKDEAGARPAEDHSSMPSFFRRGKKVQEEEPKQELDLTAALPPTDDFRTSLLMTGLSARFSMLREQDDPKSKIGKASDDSVLFPKRQSRLMEYGYGGLADIAEVESIRAPPSFSRMDSYISDDADSTKDSIMNRAKPTEGNNLFGGRQKIYKIPAGGGKGDGVLGGRALYEDDVAMSAFQKWRNTEKTRNTSFEYDEKEMLDGPRGSDDYQYQRSESPVPPGYNRKRETSSTTSSTPSLARNSTAATSVGSGPTQSIKDWQSQSTAPTSASSTPALDRAVTRTRRLYEPGLSQELQDQQSSALSRIDTLSGKRTLGSRTPDLAQHSPSPTTYGFADRFGSERRPILTKASAPNLRSISPPTTASSSGTMDKIPALPESKSAFGGTPPLSPPVSEGDHSFLPIQPNDRGKATAMGVFQKPVQAYDESKYAQRQLQLQQGRETPTQRFRAESNASYATGRSRASSAAPAQNDAVQAESSSEAIQVALQEEDGEAQIKEQTLTLPASAHLERPSDQDHPAFRQAALPTPLSLTSKISDEPSPVVPEAVILPPNDTRDSPEDSPTLGPTPGLSGIVRQHLRSESDASSIYGGAPQTAGLESKFPTDSHDSKFMDTLAVKALGNPWDEQDWHLSFYGTKNGQGKEARPEPEAEKPELPSQDVSNRTSDNLDDEEDEFASQLRNARRRVQERLTTYVESESSRGASPLLAPSDPPVAPPSRSNPLGILRGKSSRGSLLERPRDASQSKAMKMLGLGASTMSTTPSPSKQEFEEGGPVSTEEEDKLPIHDAEPDVPAEPDENGTEGANGANEENVHPGLRAFRQARRELQKRKELETLARHKGRDQPSSQATPIREQDGRHRTPSRDRKPPPVFYQSRAPSEESRGGIDSRSSSRPSSRADRDRSGSEASNGRSYSRPARLRNNSSPYDHERGLAPGDPSRQQPARSPGLPGTDIRRSPFMPPQPYPSSGYNSPGRGDRSPANGNLTVQGRGGFEYLGHPSPISPLTMGMPGSPFLGPSPAGSGASTPTTATHRRPSAPPTPSFATTSSINDSMKRPVNKFEISEPSFLMSTSRVPTVSLPQSTSSPDLRAVDAPRNGTRSRSGSNAAGYAAPPLPPINPMRKREGSRPRPPFMGRMGDMDETPASASSPHLPLAGSSSGPVADRAMFSASDDEDERGGRYGRPRKNSEAYRANGRNGGSAPPRRTQRTSPPFVATGPPASRAVITSTIPGGMI